MDFSGYTGGSSASTQGGIDRSDRFETLMCPPPRYFRPHLDHYQRRVTEGGALPHRLTRITAGPSLHRHSAASFCDSLVSERASTFAAAGWQGIRQMRGDPANSGDGGADETDTTGVHTGECRDGGAAVGGLRDDGASVGRHGAAQAARRRRRRRANGLPARARAAPSGARSRSSCRTAARCACAAIRRPRRITVTSARAGT